MWKIIIMLVIAVVICAYFNRRRQMAEQFEDANYFEDYHPVVRGNTAWGGRDLRWQWRWPKSAYGYPVKWPQSRLYWW